MDRIKFVYQRGRAMDVGESVVVFVGEKMGGMVGLPAWGFGTIFFKKNFLMREKDRL